MSASNLHPRPIVPFAVGTAGIALFSVMDALMKGLSLAIGTYNALLWRTAAGALIGGAVYFLRRSPRPGRAALRVHLIRGSMGSVMAVTFFWGLARVPLAQAIALAFVAPLIALYLAALLLKERIERSAIIASLLGFAGVVVILAGQAQAEMGREALLGSISILVSATLYGWNIILMRQQAQLAGPVEIAFFMALIMASCFALGAPFLAEPPPLSQLPAIVAAAALAFGSLLLLSWAYARAEAQRLAPVEYTGFIWASIFGWLIFAEPVRPLTLAGAAMIVGACWAATRPNAAPMPAVEAGA
ncbi:MAG: S-adenosylmethionine uptake transporter [Sphingomonadales bacterium]|jgi:S-adenosylmethionine uptake transporter|nr:S-adenosylmethionine uptake transporter [Sphingomonadales bacterium]